MCLLYHYFVNDFCNRIVTIKWQPAKLCYGRSLFGIVCGGDFFYFIFFLRGSICECHYNYVSFSDNEIFFFGCGRFLGNFFTFSWVLTLLLREFFLLSPFFL